MARATVSGVQVILPAGSSATDAQVQAAIDSATLLIDQVADGCGSNLPDAQLTQAEIWLSAHFTATFDPSIAISEESAEGMRIKYQTGVASDGFLGTAYGRRANLLTNGCLAELEKTPINLKSIGAIGSDYTF